MTARPAERTAPRNRTHARAVLETTLCPALAALFGRDSDPHYEVQGLACYRYTIEDAVTTGIEPATSSLTGMCAYRHTPPPSRAWESNPDLQFMRLAYPPRLLARSECRRDRTCRARGGWVTATWTTIGP